MFKLFALLFNFLGLLLCSLFFPVAVNVSQTAPGSVQINNSFLVQVAINKAGISGMARFTEQLPKGFSAVAIDRGGAQTKFDNNAIIFSWDSLLPGGIISISFKVDVNSSAVIQTDTLTGRLLYTTDNQKMETDGLPTYIKINGISSGGNGNSPKMDSTKPTTNPVFVMRGFSSNTIASDSSTIVTLTIHKANMKGFAKLEDSLPVGFKAKVISSKGASFTFDGNIVKFVWPRIPSDSVIIVSYRIKAGRKINGVYGIGGDFSYLNNGIPASCLIGRTYFNTTSAPVSAKDTVIKTTQKTLPDTAPINSAMVTPSIPAPQKGINYRVQLMALHTPVDVSYFSQKKKINGTINSEINGGFTKYTTGNYTDYKSVRDAREEFRNQGIDGPFVVSYNSGARITVQEALMITRQQWYK
jgi:hypothetical protein